MAVAMTEGTSLAIFIPRVSWKHQALVGHAHNHQVGNCWKVSVKIMWLVMRCNKYEIYSVLQCNTTCICITYAQKTFICIMYTCVYMTWIGIVFGGRCRDAFGSPAPPETSLRLNQDSMQLMHQVWMWRQCGRVWVWQMSPRWFEWGLRLKILPSFMVYLKLF